MIKDSSHPPPILCQVSPKNYRLFVVDDDLFVRTSYVRRLRRVGYQVKEFESGESVIEYLNHTKNFPDVILLDFKMTGLNGLETTKVIRQLSSSVPVILLTAYGGVINEDEAKQEGVFTIVTKTIDLECLPEVIHHAIEHHGP